MPNKDELTESIKELKKYIYLFNNDINAIKI